MAQPKKPSDAREMARNTFVDPKDISYFVFEEWDVGFMQLWTSFATKLKHEFGGETPYSMKDEGFIMSMINAREIDRILIQYRGDTCGFAHFAYTNETWCLIAIYIMPELRRKGIFTSLYPQFQHEYGNFVVAPPYSEAMSYFLEKKNNTL